MIILFKLHVRLSLCTELHKFDLILVVLINNKEIPKVQTLNLGELVIMRIAQLQYWFIHV